MIGTKDIEIQAANPSLPIPPVYDIVGSKQSFRIRNVPRKIGKWHIDSVKIYITTPDDFTEEIDCVLIGGVWVGSTKHDCEIAGTSKDGFVVKASGEDENGDPISEYILGVGDVEIVGTSGSTRADAPLVHYVDNPQGTSHVGDLSAFDETIKVWDGQKWVGKDVNSVNPKILPDWLYMLDFNSSYDEFGKSWREEHFGEIEVGGCSSAFKNGVMMRNYDWKYSDAAEFVVSLPRRIEGGDLRFATVGVGGLGSFLTKTMVESGEYTSLYKAVPSMLQDGVNEFGVKISIHVCKSNPLKDSGWQGNSIDAFGAIRYALEHFRNFQDAAEWIQQNVYLPQAFVQSTGYSVMFVVTDGTEGMVVQDGVARPLETGCLTNFRLLDDDFSEFHTSRYEVAEYDPYGQGIERLQRMSNALDEILNPTVSDMFQIASSVHFSNAYNEEHPFITDFTDESLGLSLASPDDEFEDSMNIASLGYDGRDRFHPTQVEYQGETYEIETWQSIHSCVYVGTELHIRVQEGDDESIFVIGNSPQRKGYTLNVSIEAPIGYYPVTQKIEVVHSDQSVEEINIDSGEMTIKDVVQVNAYAHGRSGSGTAFALIMLDNWIGDYSFDGDHRGLAYANLSYILHSDRHLTIQYSSDEMDE